MIYSLLLSCWLSLVLASCHLSDPTNPIHREDPAAYFPAGPALQLAQAIRAEDAPALDKVFAQHPDLDPNLVGSQGVTFLFWAYAHHSVPMLRALVRHGADVNRQLRLPHPRPDSDRRDWLGKAAARLIFPLHVPIRQNP